MTAPDPYERLAELFERDLELAGNGDFEALLRTGDERAALIASLGENPPASARAALERASLLQQRVTIELLRGRESLLLALAQLQRAERTAQGYAAQRRRVARVETSA